jgi:hypothetical protein
VGEERLRTAGGVGADQDRVPVPMLIGDLSQRVVENLDVVGEHSDVGDRASAVGHRDSQIDQYPPGIVSGPRPTQPRQSLGQLTAQRRPIRDICQQP